eukprot:TRINITY_DN1681_c0_g1_i5.p1 TRINITY_DN1681_c0_g1~~TRINITY_DN1681_c0_g1_i5.p1  ORF type:complete len:405 (+),score=76.80 TRINITY_DN1681_c0_g1_i5:56-1216(+)
MALRLLRSHHFRRVRLFSSSIEFSDYSNVTQNIKEKIGRNLHLQPSHPLNILRNLVVDHFNKVHVTPDGKPIFKVFDNLHPVVHVSRNFDKLLVPADHVSRRKTDTFYVNQDHVLRTHTTAHESELMERGEKSFLVFGDVYRRDEIDASHYPVFHQLEAVRLWSHDELGTSNLQKRIDLIMPELQKTIEGVARTLFGDAEMRWVETTFPFTEPSLELEVMYQGNWLEVLGCGMLHDKIINAAGLKNHSGWALGMGMERLAMVLFNIPDIRLFWSQDSRFLDQFKDGKIVKFQPYSKYPPCYKDISFWLPPNFHENDLCSEIRNVAGDLVEQVKFVSEFTHPKTQRVSRCYRILYRSMDRSLTNAEIDVLQSQIRTELSKWSGIELR